MQNTRSKDRVRGTNSVNGLWLSLVERLVRDQEAVGSNPTSPIIFVRNILSRFLVLVLLIAIDF